MKSNLPYLSAALLAAGFAVAASAQVATNQSPSNTEPSFHAGCGGVVMVAVDRGPIIAPASGTFHISATFDSGITAAQRAVIQQAINEWDAIIQSRGVNPGTYPISFRYGPLAAGTLAVTSVSYDSGSGDLIKAAMTISTGYTWYEDANPATDDEFSQTPRPTGYDLLSVVRHELGHAMGWVTGSSRVTSLVGDNIFDSSRLNISLVPGDTAHANAADHPLELMQPTIGPSTRRPIRLYPTAAYVARAFHYQIPMQFVDPNSSGTQTGTAWEPWHALPFATLASPSGTPLLLAPATLSVARNQMLITPHTLYAARGSAVVNAP